jgi:hypothetical protein
MPEKEGCVRLEAARSMSLDPDGTPVVRSLMSPEDCPAFHRRGAKRRVRGGALRLIRGTRSLR